MVNGQWVSRASFYRVRWTSRLHQVTLSNSSVTRRASAKSFFHANGASFDVDTSGIEFRVSTVPQFLASRMTEAEDHRTGGTMTDDAVCIDNQEDSFDFSHPRGG